MRRLDLLQWFALLAAPLAWVVQLVVGFGVNDANCASAGSQWGISVDTWMIALAAAAGTIAVCAEISAVTLYRDVRDVDEDAPGPRGRLLFFSVAALVGNVLFMALITLTAFGSLYHNQCRQS